MRITGASARARFLSLAPQDGQLDREQLLEGQTLARDFAGTHRLWEVQIADRVRLAGVAGLLQHLARQRLRQQRQVAVDGGAGEPPHGAAGQALRERVDRHEAAHVGGFGVVQALPLGRVELGPFAVGAHLSGDADPRPLRQ